MLEFMLLKYGLNHTPAPLHIIAKRIGVRETEKNVAVVRKELEKLLRMKRVFKSGNRYAIDAEGARMISEKARMTDLAALPTPENFQKSFRQLVAK